MDYEEPIERFLGWRQVRHLTGLGRTTAWRMRQSGDFPHPVPISPGRVAWRERDIVAWNQSRGALIPAAPRSTPISPCAPPVSPSRRDAASRTVPAVSAPLAQGQVCALSHVPCSVRPGRRKRSILVEGQLGFDF
ncbi:AlpA family transcriptional regulator [Brevundimonas sp. PAMC22021]|uniref:helix-turn-helix transcriptional regulator n=1 Tax=Brevundimonas sp. PAMC22021 TaxID=2861285 RepID=UPI001C62EC53|nr:AlpA family phage regulatory protein [Brevundimonas sp. PAMC22021]